MDNTFEPVRAPARVLQIIYQIALSPSGLTLARLVTLTGLPKTSLLSLLRSLEASNYVDNVRGGYRLGRQMLELAAVIRDKEQFLPTARPALRSLFEETGETVQICVLSSDEPAAESVEVIETQKPIRLSLPLGLRRPLYCSAVGKLLLAFQGSEWISEYFKATSLKAYTVHTVTKRHLLRAELTKVRAQGWCLSHQGMFDDSSGMAAAIYDEQGRVLGGVSLVAPTYRLQRDEERIRAAVVNAARNISAALGYCDGSNDRSNGAAATLDRTRTRHCSVSR